MITMIKLRQRILHLAIGGLMATTSALFPAMLSAQDTRIVIEPLFEYPSAPDSIPSLEGKSDWVVTNFWTPMDFSGNRAVDQSALNDAMRVFAVPMQWASADVTEKALAKIINESSRNPVLAIQLTKAAEEAFYGPRAPFWSDKIYLMFIDGLLKNKKVKQERKLRYKRTGEILRNTIIGSRPPKFNYLTPEGKRSTFTPNGIFTVIEFGDPGCDECRHARLKMESDVRFGKLVERGLVNVMFIIPDPEEGWQEDLKGYSPKWHVGGSDEVSDLYDLRESPSFYIIDQNGNVAAKNITVETALELTKSQMEQ